MKHIFKKHVAAIEDGEQYGWFVCTVCKMEATEEYPGNPVCNGVKWSYTTADDRWHPSPNSIFPNKG